MPPYWGPMSFSGRVSRVPPPDTLPWTSRLALAPLTGCRFWSKRARLTRLIPIRYSEFCGDTVRGPVVATAAFGALVSSLPHAASAIGTMSRARESRAWEPSMPTSESPRLSRRTPPSKPADARCRGAAWTVQTAPCLQRQGLTMNPPTMKSWIVQWNRYGCGPDAVLALVRTDQNCDEGLRL